MKSNIPQPAPQTISTSASQHQNAYSGSPSVYQDLRTCNGWPVKKSHCPINWPIRLKGNLNKLPVIH